MGFEQDSTKKSYYVDGHEKPEQVLHRAQFNKTYLTEIEPRCHRWISIEKEEFKVLQQSISNAIIHEGYSYHDHTIGKDMVEFHVDDHLSLQDLANKKYPVFGGGMSVRAPPGSKPIIVLGQDEAVFNENSKQWVGPNGERPILPKNMMG